MGEVSSSDPGTGPGRLGGRDSRFIHLDMGQRREGAVDARTMVLSLDALQAPFEALYLAHYRAMREIGRHVTEPGVALVAVHVPTCSLAGRAWVAAKPGQPSALIFGRHSRADLMVEDPGLSLRHLALVSHPPTGWEPGAMRFAVHDLRTASAFEDERGRRLEAIVAEGPALFSAGRHALFAFPTGDPSAWPELATDAWAMWPERVYVAERSAEPDRWRRGPHAAPRRTRDGQTLITSIPGVLRAEDRLRLDGEPSLGTLRISTERGQRRYEIGAAALARGVLVGRYPRCEGADLLTDAHVSRAHVLLLRVAERVWAIDTASTGGTSPASRPGQPRRVIALDEGPLVLGEHRATLEWVTPRAGDRSRS
ncbi:MAG: FHA domain-containing protein [Sandaracinaceae bacterium]|nr:MAG: FHA domain-containing protein [Sandaracinaceae bacterium]